MVHACDGSSMFVLRVVLSRCRVKSGWTLQALWFLIS